MWPLSEEKGKNPGSGECWASRIFLVLASLAETLLVGPGAHRHSKMLADLVNEPSSSMLSSSNQIPLRFFGVFQTHLCLQFPNWISCLQPALSIYLSWCSQHSYHKATSDCFFLSLKLFKADPWPWGSRLDLWSHLIWPASPQNIPLQSTKPLHSSSHGLLCPCSCCFLRQ